MTGLRADLKAVRGQPERGPGCARGLCDDGEEVQLCMAMPLRTAPARLSASLLSRRRSSPVIAPTRPRGPPRTSSARWPTPAGSTPSRPPHEKAQRLQGELEAEQVHLAAQAPARRAQPLPWPTPNRRARPPRWPSQNSHLRPPFSHPPLLPAGGQRVSEARGQQPQGAAPGGGAGRRREAAGQRAGDHEDLQGARSRPGVRLPHGWHPWQTFARLAVADRPPGVAASNPRCARAPLNHPCRSASAAWSGSGWRCRTRWAGLEH
jgi:hypothetical protein